LSTAQGRQNTRGPRQHRHEMPRRSPGVKLVRRRDHATEASNAYSNTTRSRGGQECLINLRVCTMQRFKLFLGRHQHLVSPRAKMKNQAKDETSVRGRAADESSALNESGSHAISKNAHSYAEPRWRRDDTPRPSPQHLIGETVMRGQDPEQGGTPLAKLDPPDVPPAPEARNACTPMRCQCQILLADLDSQH